LSIFAYSFIILSHEDSGAIEGVKEAGLEVLLTVRSEKEGGKHVENRREIFESLSPLCDYTDIELSSKDLLGFVRDIVKESGCKTCGYTQILGGCFKIVVLFKKG